MFLVETSARLCDYELQKFFGATGLILKLMDDTICSSFFLEIIEKKCEHSSFEIRKLKNHTRSDLVEAFSSPPYIEKIGNLARMFLSVPEHTVCIFGKIPLLAPFTAS